MITLKKIIETCGNIEIYKEGRWMPVTEEVQQKFDIDLEFGRLGEDFVKAFQGKNNKIEVKTERGQWKDTGNIAIEIAKRQGDKIIPSCLNITDAKWWIHILKSDDLMHYSFIFPVVFHISLSVLTSILVFLLCMLLTKSSPSLPNSKSWSNFI